MRAPRGRQAPPQVQGAMNPQEPAGKAEPTAREPPARAIVLVGDKPHQYVEVAFPWELNNTDYLRRVLGQVTLSLRPLYLDAVKSGACAKVRTGDNYEVGASQADAFYILKHILENLHHYAEVTSNPLRRLGSHQGAGPYLPNGFPRRCWVCLRTTYTRPQCA